MSTPNTPEPLDPSLLITLPSFEGPLDLLLHLIRKHELDILDLPIAFVTERYLEYVTMMEKLDLDIASEYLVMAATLAHIKSKMLLPQEPDDQPDDDVPEEEIDPRAELIRRLLEYQKYKDAAEKLGARGIIGRDVFPRGSDAPEAGGPPALAPTSLFQLLDAFQAVLQRAQADLAFEITAEGISIQDRMRQLTELLRERREVTFDMLFEGQVTVYDIVITFMAILEMAKRRLVRIFQADPHSPIHLQSTVLDEEVELDAFDPDADDFTPGRSGDEAPGAESGVSGASATEVDGAGEEEADLHSEPHVGEADRVEFDFDTEPDSSELDTDFDAALESGALDFDDEAASDLTEFGFEDELEDWESEPETLAIPGPDGSRDSEPAHEDFASPSADPATSSAAPAEMAESNETSDADPLPDESAASDEDERA